MMLTESFIVSTLNPEKPGNTVATGVHLHDFQPLPALKFTFKKSSTNPNCLAVSSSHIFAVQADKAVVHVYSRERNNQEAVVPFPERIHSIALAGESDGAGTLVLGTEGGRVILWELATGRQVLTPQHHLQPATCLAVDPTANFLLSGSTDSTIHVWSIPGLLSFSASTTNDFGQDLPFSPLRSLSNHRAAVTAIAIGHSASRNNIAVSASKDNSCIVWDFSSGDALHTYLLSASPLCLALDPADRAVYAGYEDGTIQFIDFYSQGGLIQPLHDPALQSTPTQPPPAARWSAPDSGSAVLCIQVSYDGTCLLSGHQDGKIYKWEIAAGRYDKQLADFSAPITNLHMLKPSGSPKVTKSPVKLHNVVKPRYESFANGNNGDSGATMPSNYTFTAQFTSNIALHGSPGSDSFHEALTHPSFPASFLDNALAEFSASQNPAQKAPDSTDLAELRAQNASLASQLSNAVERGNSAAAEIQQRDKENWMRQKDEEIKAARKKRRRLRRMRTEEVARKKEMGEGIDSKDVEMGDDSNGEENLSSSTDELTDSG